MNITLKRAIIFLIIALLAAFVAIPSYEMFVGDQPFEEVRQQVLKNISFESYDIWKRVFTFYLALWCGKAILWALSTASMRQE